MDMILISKEDSSANVVMGKFEARFVQRTPDYFIIYVSSHQGCNQSCRFCHLTQTKQTDMTPATISDYAEQVDRILEYWDKNHGHTVGALRKVHINFMARGEPLLNPTVIHQYDILTHVLRDRVQKKVGKLEVVFNISTIFPAEVVLRDTNFDINNVRNNTMIYYSLYSMDPQFRKRWLPKAKDPVKALEELRDYRYKVHFALIEGENDSEQDAKWVAKAVYDAHRLSHYEHTRPGFNLVRYNPYSELQGKEPPAAQLESYLQVLANSQSFRDIRVVSRVGRDVYASCGTFVNLLE
jgi:adenine C2-methylase RlmN of 23S rRNA A2503 and tRNA A37